MVLRLFFLIVLTLTFPIAAASAGLPIPTIEATSYGPSGEVRTYVAWTLSGSDLQKDEETEDYGFRFYRSDVTTPLVDVTPRGEGYGDGTAGGWIEDESVIEDQVYTYSVEIYDRSDATSARSSVSVRATADVGGQESECTVQPSLKVSVTGKAITLSWPEMCAAQKYEIWRELVDEPETGPFSTKASQVKLVSGLTNDQRTYTDTVDKPGRYLYTVFGYQILSGTPSETLPPALLPPAAYNLFGIGVVRAEEPEGTSLTPPPGTVGEAKAEVKVGEEETKKEPEPAAEGEEKADPKADGASATSNTLVDPNKNIAENLEELYKASIPILLWLVILMLIVAGYIYITSMGGQDKVKLAKEIVVSTLVGAALLLLLPLILQALGQ